MPLQKVLTREVREWFAMNGHLIDPFMIELVRVCQDELTLMRLTVPERDPASPYMLRAFRFPGGTALLEWHHARQLVRVVAVRLSKAENPPEGA